VAPGPVLLRPSNWYYCNSPAGYYPYVTQCSGPWQQVTPPASAAAAPPADAAPAPAAPEPAPAAPAAPEPPPGYSPPSYPAPSQGSYPEQQPSGPPPAP
jgi:hypothetical protein